MKRTLAFGFALALIAAVALAATRPAGELQMFTMLNGHPTRWVMTDGGVSGMYGTGIQCVPLTTCASATCSTLLVVPTAPVNVMLRPSPNQTWDSGMSQVVGDLNFGEPLQPWVPRYFVPHGGATHLCQTTDAGSSAATPVWQML